MAKFDNPLDNIKIASPCSQNWDAMTGIGRKRYCGECKLNVYNLSGMTRAEAESLLINSEGRLCVRFYRRQDGTILTRDCPVGWQAIKKRISRTAAAFVSLLFGLLGGIEFMNYFNQKEERHLMGAVKIDNLRASEPLNSNTSIMMGNIAYEEKDNAALMGMPIIEKPRQRK